MSKKSDRFLPLLDLRTPIVPAALRNDAGIIGAAAARRRGRLSAPARTFPRDQHGTITMPHAGQGWRRGSSKKRSMSSASDRAALLSATDCR